MLTVDLIDQINGFTVLVTLASREQIIGDSDDGLVMLIDGLSLLHQYASAFLADARVRSTQGISPEVGLGDIVRVTQAMAMAQVSLMAKLADIPVQDTLISDIDEIVVRLKGMISTTGE